MKVDTDLGSLSDAAKLIRENAPQSVQRSSVGGYHSPVYSESSEDLPGMFGELVDGIEWYARRFLEDLCRREVNIGNSECWFMINGRGDYNMPHTHMKSDLSAVFYISAPDRCGNLILNRTDGAQYSTLSQESLFTVSPEAGRLYFFPSHLQHWVEPSEVDEERISFVMNLYLE